MQSEHSSQTIKQLTLWL